MARSKSNYKRESRSAASSRSRSCSPNDDRVTEVNASLQRNDRSRNDFEIQRNNTSEKNNRKDDGCATTNDKRRVIRFVATRIHYFSLINQILTLFLRFSLRDDDQCSRNDSFVRGKPYGYRPNKRSISYDGYSRRDGGKLKRYGHNHGRPNSHCHDHHRKSNCS